MPSMKIILGVGREAVDGSNAKVEAIGERCIRGVRERERIKHNHRSGYTNTHTNNTYALGATFSKQGISDTRTQRRVSLFF